MFLAADGQLRCYNRYRMNKKPRLGSNIQMDRYTPCAQVINPQNTTNHISAHVVEYQDLPYGVAIFIQDRS